MKFKWSVFILAASLIAVNAAGCASSGAEGAAYNISDIEEMTELSEEDSAEKPETEAVEEAEQAIVPETEVEEAESEPETEGESEQIEPETETSAGEETEEEADSEINTQAEIETVTDTESDTETQTEAEAQTVTYVKVTADNVNIRSGAGTGYTVLGTAEDGTLYSYEGEYNGWYKIGYCNSYAYISQKYTTLTELEASDNELIESVIAAGTRLLGTEYVYGAVRYHDGNGNKLSGFTVTEFDCSSLMQYIFYVGADVLLGTTTRTQVLQGTTVARSQLQRGDFIFFTNSSRYNNTGIERIGHVALYLGDNYILHTSSDYAKIEQISSTRWSYYIQAQRMI